MLTRLCLSSLVAIGLALGPIVALAQDGTVEQALARVPEVAPTVLNHDDDMARATGAIAVCTLAVSDPDKGIALLNDAGWLIQPAEEGETVFADNQDGVNLVTIVNEGGDCTVNTTASGTADVMKNFFDTTDALGWPPYDWTDDGDMGCLNAPLAPDLLAVISGAGDACTSPDAATVRITEGGA